MRWLVTLLVVGGALILGSLVCIQAAPGTSAENSHPPPQWKAPSLARLDAAIGRSEGFLDGLYKPLGHHEATVSENFGLPLRIYSTAYHRWELAGEDRTAYCRPVCVPTTHITPLSQRPSTESFIYHFRSPAGDDAPAVLANVNWSAGNDTYRVTLKNIAFSDPRTQARLYLGSIYVGTFSSSNVGTSKVLTLPYDRRSLLQSFRYTFRHGTQAGNDFYLYRNDRQRARALANFLISNGLKPNLDLRAPVWGFGNSYPNDMPYRRDMYQDCSTKPPAETPMSYPYSSKVCRLGADTFINLTPTDPLVPTMQAIHVLNKGEEPDYRYATPDGETTSEGTASWLESEFTHLGYGIPECNPLVCDYHYASGPRTFAFGNLETLLGYKYGNKTSKRYSNRVAQIALRTQVGKDGLIRREKGSVYRPMQRGGSLTSWDSELRYTPPDTLIKNLVGHANMPMEYRGMIVANSETTFDAYAFLIRYRCLVYGKSCSEQIERMR